MEIAYNIKQAKEIIAGWKKQGLSIGFVPTMGFLHEGHQSLIHKSVLQNQKTIVSIFVNPIQFGPSEDFKSYPRDFDADSKLCKQAEVDLIFYPTDKEMFGQGFCSFVDVDGITNQLCGKSRPGHFRGVCTIVAKLFNILTPDRAYFGQKDAQQLAVVQAMVRDLNIDVKIIGCPIVRDANGLAKSSRNSYLTSEQTKTALVLSKAIFKAEKLITQGQRDCNKIILELIQLIQAEPLAKIDYIEIVDSRSMQKIDKIQGSVLIAIAVYVGNVRLIDNTICKV